MILSMSGQAWLFLSTVLLGAGVGFVYDIFRIFRKTAPRFARRAAAVQLEDLFFWLCVTLGVFYFMLVRNFGEIRFFSVIGMFIGTVLYFYTLSRHVIFIFVHIINFLKKIIVLPFKLAHKWLSPILAPAYKKIRSHLRRFSRFGKIRLKKSARNWFIFRHKK